MGMSREHQRDLTRISLQAADERRLITLVPIHLDVPIVELTWGNTGHALRICAGWYVHEDPYLLSEAMCGSELRIEPSKFRVRLATGWCAVHECVGVQADYQQLRP